MRFRQKPRAHAGVLAAVIHIAEESGVNVASLLSENGIDPDIREDANAVVPINRIHGFLSAIPDKTGDEFFLWNSVLNADPAGFGYYGQLAVNARTVEDALTAIAHNIRHLVSNSSVDMKDLGRETRITYRLHDEGTDICRQESEVVVAFSIALARQALGPSWMPERIYFEHSHPINASNYGANILSRVEFDFSGSGIAITNSDLAAKMPGADIYLDAAVGHYVEQVVGKSIMHGTNALALRRELGPRLPGGAPVLEDVASEFGMSPRTMQRRLSDEGTSYSNVLEDLRKDMANRLLPNRALTITEISYLLGYGDLSSFDRAYRKWNGRAPANDRRQALARQHLSA